jgi:hypothetical protein
LKNGVAPAAKDKRAPTGQPKKLFVPAWKTKRMEKLGQDKAGPTGEHNQTTRCSQQTNQRVARAKPTFAMPAAEAPPHVEPSLFSQTASSMLNPRC